MKVHNGAAMVKCFFGRRLRILERAPLSDRTSREGTMKPHKEIYGMMLCEFHPSPAGYPAERHTESTHQENHK